MGFLTGEETPAFLDAHVGAAFITGSAPVPFRRRKPSDAETRHSVAGRCVAAATPAWLIVRDGARGVREPFAADRYDFGTCRMTERNSAYIATMLQGRLTPPPRACYTLHRKLSGAFLSHASSCAPTSSAGSSLSTRSRSLTRGTTRGFAPARRDSRPRGVARRVVWRRGRRHAGTRPRLHWRERRVRLVRGEGRGVSD